MKIFTAQLEMVMGRKDYEKKTFAIIAGGGMGKSKLISAMKSRATKYGFR